jgi:hypothetical protein
MLHHPLILKLICHGNSIFKEYGKTSWRVTKVSSEYLVNIFLILQILELQNFQLKELFFFSFSDQLIFHLNF